ncbi:FAD:protein FMN transferase [Gryllotalpicola reticulitermitis]|uniref:FAD:protein FMN transferase n=1 Tax=Gryllotalpicola reticulitermitis TaxID=1184153 RepID=A0ABV8Q0K7_9MICO
MTPIHHCMGTVVSLDLRVPAPDALVARAFAVFDDAEARFSPFRADSELSRVGRSELALAEASTELREVLAIGEAFERASGGAFSLRHDGRLDANGVVKGWATQRAADLLSDGGATDFCLNAGGDLVTRGAPAPRQRWQAGIRDPRDPAHLLGVMVLGEAAMATSGAYERGPHIFDGRSGESARYWASITVVDPDLTVADVLATAVFAMGPAGPGWAHREFGCSVVAARPDGGIVVAGPVEWAESQVPQPAPTEASLS